MRIAAMAAGAVGEFGPIMLVTLVLSTTHPLHEAAILIAFVAVAVVLVNLVLAAVSLSWAARRSLTLLMAVALGGFLVRMGLVTAVMLAVRNQPWIDLVALGVTVLVTHLGLLFWELRYVSASLAYPALKPGHKEAVQP